MRTRTTRVVSTSHDEVWTVVSPHIDPTTQQERKLARLPATRKLTPTEEIGPSYPVGTLVDRGDDLTVDPRTGERAFGQRMIVTGQIFLGNGSPVANATVEMWQANAHGRYAHPSDLNPVPLDPAFEGYGSQLTGADGRYRFVSIKPGPYPTGVPGWWRPPHVHFQVTTATDRCVTQMYFPGDPLNDKDELLARHRKLGAEDRVVAAVLPPGAPGGDAELVTVVFDITIAPGQGES